jgi:anti-sigma factor RsiW
MPDKLPCPDGQILRSFLLGQGSASQSGAVEQHLEQCDRCVETLHALGTEDTLTEALRHGPEKAVLGSADDQVEGLIDRMCKLRPAGAAPAEDAIVLPNPRRQARRPTTRRPMISWRRPKDRAK